MTNRTPVLCYVLLNCILNVDGDGGTCKYKVALEQAVGSFIQTFNKTAEIIPFFPANCIGF